ncbi:solute carrier family 25 (mitochondrial phosphate transporter), member 3 [Angomonas deanei]|uniref:Mitochondrial carrier protein, putative n=1 Tax=Angomonas deanei TaxID=59799 RepID=A0A7G2CVZ2_9TRYP|nr:solute carrier family 25 (mitochondrial phosphate transporter), member 3 [Angomonas deanei]CAD2222492.1 Mitochondrial carrier protein, putative [Angomonas deanei]|eukprot:EPY43128.1 solute carrier family 25 (mitochondrial phosphate transporter), member 3 [Angomonas deanei]
MFSQEAKSSLWRSVPVFFKGIVPTAIGYCSQGTLKFGFYELFKYYLGATGRGGAMSVFIFLLSSCLAELLADLALAPWEAVKVKIQTNKQMPTVLGAVLQLMWAEEGIQAFYKGLVPLWGRQVPMTMMKFASFEKIVVTLHYLARHRKASNVKNLIITVLAGIFSGVLCTIVSHPGDVLVSRLNQKVVEPQTNLETDRGLLGVIRAIGWRGLWKGLSARIVMICCITASQWFIYDTFKIAVGLSTTGKAKN